LVFGGALPDAATFDAMATRTEADWEFMSEKIGAAIKRGVILDDAFVEELAARRFEHAQVILAGERPGPTLESSRRIVREVVAIHQLALGGSGPDQS
jgi:hypothetical protein